MIKDILTKELLITYLNEAKQDENGHWYVEKEKDEIDIKFGIGGQRIYFGMFYTVCYDFVSEYTYKDGDNTEHYNRHFSPNDDTFELVVAKNEVSSHD